LGDLRDDGATILYDQLLSRPLVTWADKFRFEQTAALVASKSWVLELFRRSRLLTLFTKPIGMGLHRAARAPLTPPRRIYWATTWSPPRRVVCRLERPAHLHYRLRRLDTCAVCPIDTLLGRSANRRESNGGLTLLRVVILVALASMIWVTIGVAVGLRPKLREKIQPVAQFLAAFPANLFFPVAVFFILRFDLAPKIWLCPLMILGTQWYILFNVFAGASAFPSDFREAAASYRVRPWRGGVRSCCLASSHIT
jgi:NitT/TauT family transport system permease protein